MPHFWGSWQQAADDCAWNSLSLSRWLRSSRDGPLRTRQRVGALLASFHRKYTVAAPAPVPGKGAYESLGNHGTHRDPYYTSYVVVVGVVIAKALF